MSNKWISKTLAIVLTCTQWSSFSYADSAIAYANDATAAISNNSEALRVTVYTAYSEKYMLFEACGKQSDQSAITCRTLGKGYYKVRELELLRKQNISMAKKKIVSSLLVVGGIAAAAALAIPMVTSMSVFLVMGATVGLVGSYVAAGIGIATVAGGVGAVTAYSLGASNKGIAVAAAGTALAAMTTLGFSAITLATWSAGSVVLGIAGARALGLSPFVYYEKADIIKRLQEQVADESQLDMTVSDAELLLENLTPIQLKPVMTLQATPTLVIP